MVSSSQTVVSAKFALTFGMVFMDKEINTVESHPFEALNTAVPLVLLEL